MNFQEKRRLLVLPGNLFQINSKENITGLIVVSDSFVASLHQMKRFEHLCVENLTRTPVSTPD